MARCSACVTGMTFTESNIALSFGGKCKNCIIRDNPKQKDKLQNKTTKQQDTIMNRITLILATVLSLAFTQVTAQDLGKGLDAYAAGDYATISSTTTAVPEAINLNVLTFETPNVAL